MSISNNYIPEKINDFNTYLDGNKMIGVAASVTLPEVKMKTSTVSGAGINGEIDSPTIGQFESMEQEIDFNVLYSSAMDMLSPLSVVNLTLRAAQQVYDKTGGYAFKGLRVVEMGRVKTFNPGKVEKGEGMEAKVTLELTYLLVENDGSPAAGSGQAERRLQGQRRGYACRHLRADLIRPESQKRNEQALLSAQAEGRGLRHIQKPKGAAL